MKDIFMDRAMLQTENTFSKSIICCCVCRWYKIRLQHLISLCLLHFSESFKEHMSCFPFSTAWSFNQRSQGIELHTQHLTTKVAANLTKPESKLLNKQLQLNIFYMSYKVQPVSGYIIFSFVCYKTTTIPKCCT